MSSHDGDASPGDNDQQNQSPADIQAEIEQTREELSETIGALTAKLDVKQRSKDKAAQARRQAGARIASAKDKTMQLTIDARSHATDTQGRPRPQVVAGAAAALIVVAGVVALVVSRRRR